MTPADARALMRRARSATLATSLAGSGGWAYASLVTVACDVDASPILLLSDLADHTRNLTQDARASLLFEFASGKANPQTGPRVTVLGRVQRDDAARLRRRFLARHPSAHLYAGFSDFRVYRMAVERAHYIGGFGKARWFEGRSLFADAKDANAIAACEEEVLAQVNGTHADALSLMAHRLLRRRGGGWTAFAIDTDGCDLRRGDAIARLSFAEGIGSKTEFLNALNALAEDAAASR